VDQQSPVTVRHAPERSRYELLDEDAVIGWTDYVPFDGSGGPQRIFYHTVVDEAYAGQGLASRLARHALEDTADAGLPVVVVCPYIKSWLAKHPEHRRLTTAVRPEHLAAVPRPPEGGAGRP